MTLATALAIEGTGRRLTIGKPSGRPIWKLPAWRELVKQAKHDDWSNFDGLGDARVSEDDDHKQARSITAQDSYIRRVANDHLGFTLERVLTEPDTPATGDQEAREAGPFGDLLAWVRTRGEHFLRTGRGSILILRKSNRLTRKLIVHATLADACRDNCVLLYYDGAILDMGSPRDRKIAAHDAIEDEHTVASTAELVQDRIDLNAAQGLPHGRETYGIRRVYHPETKALIGFERDGLKTEGVELIFSRLRSGSSAPMIVRELTERGIPPLWRKRARCPVCEKPVTWFTLDIGRNATPEGQVLVRQHKPPAGAAGIPADEHGYCAGTGQLADAPPAPSWSIGQVTAIARNRAYMGQRAHYDDPLVDAMWKDLNLVSEEDFRIVQEILNQDICAHDPSPGQGRTSEPRKKHRQRSGRTEHWASGIRCHDCNGPAYYALNHDLPVYQCAGRGDPGKPGFTTWIPAAELEAALKTAVIKRMSREDALVTLTGAAGQRAKQAEAEVAQLRIVYNEHYALAQAGRGGQAEIMADLDDQINEKLREAAMPPVPALVRKMTEAADAGVFWEKATPDQRNRILFWVMKPYLAPGGRVGFGWRGSSEIEWVQLEWDRRSAREPVSRVCPACGTTFTGHGRYCSPGCYPSQQDEARRKRYEADVANGLLEDRKAARKAAGPGPRALRRAEVLRLLAGEPQLSDKQIAEQTGMSIQGVWKIRTATPGARLSQPRRRPVA